jgi:hypothetical protein
MLEPRDCHVTKYADLEVNQLLGSTQETVDAGTDSALRRLVRAGDADPHNAHPGAAGLIFLRAIHALNVVPPGAIMTELSITQRMSIPLNRPLTTAVRVTRKFEKKGRNLVSFSYESLDGESPVLEILQTIIWPAA